MTQAYGKAFARIYNLLWTDFARSVAPLLLDYYERTPMAKREKTLLDLCCGTGQLAGHFLEYGYRVTGVDASEHMLAYARENNAAYIVAGAARFLQADVTDFHIEDRFGLVVSTFDALNHLENLDSLKKVFDCVFPLVQAGGYFIFDLNTRAGLMRWNSISVDERSDEIILVKRGIYSSEMQRAWTRISGFYRLENGLYERFEETAYNTVFELKNVSLALEEKGFRKVYFASAQDLSAPIERPEDESRVFIVAQK